LLDRRQVGHIERHSYPATAARERAIDRLFDLSCSARDDGYLRAALREGDGDFPTQSAAAAGHDRDFSRQFVTHERSR
jgi:hypothetical protein